MEEVKLSVIMPVYNVVDYVERAVQSIRQQTYRNIELVIVDDGSTDGSYDICKQLAEADARIKLVVEENQGVSAARNNGLSVVTGAYVTFVDPDDWVDSTVYEKMISYMRENDSDISVMGFTAETDNGSYEQLEMAQQQVMTSQIALTYLMDGKLYTWSIWDKIYHRRIMQNLIFDTDIVNGEDLLFNWQLFKRAKKVAYLPLHGYHYVKRTESMTNSFSERKLSVLKAFKKVLGQCSQGALYKRIHTLYLSTMISLIFGYFRSSYYQNAIYFIEIDYIQEYLRKYWWRTLVSQLSFKQKICALLFIMPSTLIGSLISSYTMMKKTCKVK